MEFEISNKDGTDLNYDETQAKYKIYCREVSQVDLTLQGGFALIGKPVKLEMIIGNHHHKALQSLRLEVTRHSPLLPILFCIDKKKHYSPNSNGANGREYYSVSSRMCFLMVSMETYKLPLIGNGIAPELEWEDLRVRRCDGNVQENYFALAAYCGVQRQTLIVAEYLDKLSVAKNTYTTVVQDIGHMLAEKVLVLPAVQQDEKLVSSIGQSVHANQSTYDGRMWSLPWTKFMGEIGGIALFQSRLDPYGQPAFLAEEIIQYSKDITPDEVDDILKMLEVSENGLDGQKANIAIARYLLNSIKKGGEVKCPNCGHLWSVHLSSGQCDEIGCACYNHKNGNKPDRDGGSPFTSLPPDPTGVADSIHSLLTKDILIDWLAGVNAVPASSIYPGIETLVNTAKLPDNLVCACGHEKIAHDVNHGCHYSGCQCIAFMKY